MGAGIDPQLAAAHARLLKDASIQFHAMRPSDSGSVALLRLLKPVVLFLGRLLAPLLRALAPIFGHASGWILLLVLALALGALFYPLARRWVRGRPQPASALNLQGALAPPSRETARALLQEADRLADAGRFGEAARILLLRSIQDVETRRPRSVPRAATAREIARLPVLSPEAQTCFSGIALAVERFAFAGLAMDRADYDACRRLYAEFALPTRWRAPSAPPQTPLAAAR